MNTRICFLLATVLLVSISVPSMAQTNPPGEPLTIGNQVLGYALDIELGLVERPPYKQLLSSGPLYAVLGAIGELDRRADESAALGPLVAAPPSPFSHLRTQGCQNFYTGGGAPKNIRVNQDCSLQRQAEEVIVINPTNPRNLIAGANDNRAGFNRCSYAWSFDSGNTWGDQIPPFYEFVLADGHTADACSDPTATFDATANAYIGGILFDINSAASAFVVAKSNAGIGGAFYHTPSVLPFQTYRTFPLGVVASDNNANIFHDKEFIVADANPLSPKANNVYATWTRFNSNTGAGVGAHSPIYFSQSTDGGATWSAGIEISGANSTFCTNFSGETNSNACDQDQGSHPIVGPDGTIYVAFGNGNTPTFGVSQHLIVKCPASANCSNQANWTPAVKITDDFGMQPIGPNFATGCAAGRQCLPPNGYRLDDFVQGSVSVDSSGKLYFVWADFRHGLGSTCDWNNGAFGQAAIATPPCDNDVFYSFSTDGGVTWSAPINVTPATEFGPTAQWQPWSAVRPDGTKLYIGYYDRSYGTCETTGCNDITLAKILHPASAPTITYKRITTSSMPNLVVANNPFQAGFLGDYMWVTVDRKGNPYVVWADTRGLNGAVEEDIYFAKPPQ